jgi:hypothetical protein
MEHRRNGFEQKKRDNPDTYRPEDLKQTSQTDLPPRDTEQSQAAEEREQQKSPGQAHGAKYPFLPVNAGR